MSRVAELLRSRRVPQVAVLALMSVGFAGCSADMQTRFSEASPIPLPSSPKLPDRCARRRRTPRDAAIRPAAASAPQYQSTRCRRPPSLRRQLIRPFGPGVGRRARDFVLCAAVQAAHRDHRHGCAALGRRPARLRRRHHDHRRHLRPLDTLARRYNVSAAAILQANGYKGPRVLSPGQRLIIPRSRGGYSRTGARAGGLQADPARRASMSSIAAIR